MTLWRSLGGSWSQLGLKSPFWTSFYSYLGYFGRLFRPFGAHLGSTCDKKCSKRAPREPIEFQESPQERFCTQNEVKMESEPHPGKEVNSAHFSHEFSVFSAWCFSLRFSTARFRMRAVFAKCDMSE